ncbi:putative transporter MCH1 [Hypsizygus marmoreus]|uniref:Transporter MCH1 n=1 Tax=Hypsizygus marmoreus TaxID=39966 RepID=A0A369JGF1_HYPMA|nr:putative transporter MCH1 [Hypsizygus marmoreus]
MSSGPNSQYFRLSLTCMSVAANSLTAGGIFMFPILSPALASILKFTQPQLTTIVLAGMVGQYPFSPLVGRILDQYGPSTCSMVSAMLFCVAFLSSALEVAFAPVKISEPSSASFHRLTAFFLVAGLGTVFSYFSSIFAASKSFPHHPGLAAGASMALFGLSPLCLSTLASKFFMDHDSGLLDIVSFLKFMALLTASTHILGAFALCSPVTYLVSLSLPVSSSSTEAMNESSSLLSRKSGVVADANSPDPIPDPYFWLLALYCLIVIGASEMVISNIGTIVLSLPPAAGRQGSTSDEVTSNQVKILSVANTLSRLVVGPLADFVSPVASHLPKDLVVYPRKHRVSRIVFLSGATLLLGLAFLWMEIGVKSREAIWLLSVSTGIAYGAVFTVLPSIISSVWGVPNLGRNFGIMTYAPFLGTPLFSYLYAFVSAANARETIICQGVSCWRTTFWVSCGTSMLAFCGSVVLWKQWKGRV